MASIVKEKEDIQEIECICGYTMDLICCNYDATVLFYQCHSCMKAKKVELLEVAE
jgi:hypothetical protein